MFRFLLTRVSLVIPTFIGITLLVFVLVRLIPGDPGIIIGGTTEMGSGSGSSSKDAWQRRQLLLDVRN